MLCGFYKGDLLFEVLEPGEIFAYDIKLDVDSAAKAYGMEVGMLHGIWYDGHAE